ncbi:hypothetical protein GEMRC1_004733 [Eukaryota sp. GEM-RC1]
MPNPIDVDKLDEQKFQEKLRQCVHAEIMLEIDKLIGTISTRHQQDKEEHQIERQQDRTKRQIERQQDKEERQIERQQDKEERQTEMTRLESIIDNLGNKWDIEDERNCRTLLIKHLRLTASECHFYRFEQDNPQDQHGRSVKVELDIVVKNSTHFI